MTDKEYPRCVRPGHRPFDPLRLASITEGTVCRGRERKYTRFSFVGVYGGISTGYAVGCCLRCIFCWVDPSRDLPEEFGKFYSPERAFDRLLKNARKGKVRKMRLSGGEPTLCRAHLLGLLELVEGTDCMFILETNGLLLGADREYVKELGRFKNTYVRVSLKAGSPEGFERRTGAKGDFYELPYRAVEYLIEENVPFHVAAMSDPRLMPPEERWRLIKKLEETGYGEYIEEEICEPYHHTVLRLREAGVRIFR